MSCPSCDRAMELAEATAGVCTLPALDGEPSVSERWVCACGRVETRLVVERSGMRFSAAFVPRND